MPHLHEKDERLSAWLDGEGSGRQLRATARLLADSAEDREHMECYRLIGEALRGEVRLRPEERLARDVSSAIARERPEQTPFWLRLQQTWVFRPAMAGGMVAVLALLAVVFGSIGEWTTPGSVPDTQYAQSESADWMNEYLAAHAEHAAAPLMFPYAQVVAYEN